VQICQRLGSTAVCPLNTPLSGRCKDATDIHCPVEWLQTSGDGYKTVTELGRDAVKLRCFATGVCRLINRVSVQGYYRVYAASVEASTSSLPDGWTALPGPGAIHHHTVCLLIFSLRPHRQIQSNLPRSKRRLSPSSRVPIATNISSSSSSSSSSSAAAQRGTFFLSA